MKKKSPVDCSVGYLAVKIATYRMSTPRRRVLGALYYGRMADVFGIQKIAGLVLLLLLGEAHLLTRCIFWIMVFGSPP